MACNTDLVQYIVDQCADAGEITARKMFGEYGIYCHSKIFGLICDDRLYIKPTETEHSPIFQKKPSNAITKKRRVR